MTLGSSQRAANQLRLGNAEARMQAAASTAQCPECGSGRFKQFPEGWQSRQEEERIAGKAAKKRGKERKAQAKAAERQTKRASKATAKAATSDAASSPGPAETKRSGGPSATPTASKPAGPLVPPPPGTLKGWLPDPTGRHELRWWTGTAYTANVSDGGRTSLDAI